MDHYYKFNNQLLRYHESRFGGDYGLLLLRIWWMLLPQLYSEYISIQNTKPIERTIYLTLSSLTLVSISSFLAVIISVMKLLSLELPRFLLRLYQILYQITLCWQILVFVIYWIAVHHTMDDLIQEHGEPFLYYLIIVHIVPFFCISTDIIFAKPVIDPSESHHTILYWIIYACSNFAQVKLYGWRPYPFLQWKDFNSIIVVVLLIGVLRLFYYLASKITKVLNCAKEKEG